MVQTPDSYFMDPLCEVMHTAGAEQVPGPGRRAAAAAAGQPGGAQAGHAPRRARRAQHAVQHPGGRARPPLCSRPCPGPQPHPSHCARGAPAAPPCSGPLINPNLLAPYFLLHLLPYHAVHKLTSWQATAQSSQSASRMIVTTERYVDVCLGAAEGPADVAAERGAHRRRSAPFHNPLPFLVPQPGRCFVPVLPQ